MIFRWLLAIAPAALFACTSPVQIGGGDAGGPDGGSSSSSSGSSSGSGSGSSSGSGGSSGGSGGSSGSSSGGGTNDLTGTWDLVATSPSGGTTSGTLLLGASTFSLDIPSTGSSLAYSANGSTLTVLWTLDGTADPIDATRAAAAMNLGIIPDDVGGTWSFSSAGSAETCTATLAPSQVSGSCNAYLYGWPNPLPVPIPGVTYTAARTQQLSSVFGDLGGTWQVMDNQGGPGSCTATFQGSTFSASCNDATDAFGGTVQLTFNGTTMASGMTGNGIELSAQKQ
ncbi:MAG TPA: hypothetical protein VF765_08825 [Polyangiaceae bacterium]